MPTLLSLATAVPPDVLTCGETKRYLGSVYPEHLAARFDRVVERTRIETRHVSMPVPSLLGLRTREERNTHYRNAAVDLAAETADRVLEAQRASGAELKCLVPVSCTGYMMPSLDARLINRLGLSTRTRRIPITELGCSGGVAGLGIAAEVLSGTGNGAALVLSVELSSLCLQLGEPSPSDVMGSILFADGAAAALVVENAEATGLEIVSSRSVLIPDSLSHLETLLTDSGLRLKLSPLLPRVLRRHLPSIVREFLETARCDLQRIEFFAVHPGGPKVIEAVRDGLGVSDDALRPSWDVLKRYGNMSSATIFFVLREIAEHRTPRAGALGLVLGFGPGVTVELLLVRWHGGLEVADLS